MEEAVNEDFDTMTQSLFAKYSMMGYVEAPRTISKTLGQYRSMDVAYSTRVLFSQDLWQQDSRVDWYTYKYYSTTAQYVL